MRKKMELQRAEDDEEDDGNRDIEGFRKFLNQKSKKNFELNGIEFNPIEDHQKLIEFRNNKFSKASQNDISDRESKGLEVDKRFITLLYLTWLKKELIIIEGWKQGKSTKGNEISSKPTNSDIQELWHYQSFVKGSIKTIEQEVTKNLKAKPIKQSYQWLGRADTDLPELYEKMIGKYISNETTLEQFQSVFTNQPINNSFEPIKWNQDNVSEVLYFIEALKKIGCLQKSTKADYIKMASCIIKPDGNSFDANFKELNQNLSINLAKNKQDEIDNLVSDYQ